MHAIIVFLLSLLFALLAEIKLISWDTAIISMSIILAAVILSLTIEEKMSAFISAIKEQIETRQNGKNDNERN